ncbi:MAG: hypothetical protein ACYS9T_03520 [Planctomycetota bacterium]|jgi:hypothetical protein
MFCKNVNWKSQVLFISALALLVSGCERKSETSKKEEPISVESREHKFNLLGTDYKIVEMEFKKELKGATMIGKQNPVVLCHVYPDSDITAFLTGNGSIEESKILYSYSGDFTFGTDFLSDGNNVYFSAYHGHDESRVYTIRALYISIDLSGEYKLEERILFRDVEEKGVTYSVPRLIYQEGSDSERMILVRRGEAFGDTPETRGKRHHWFSIPCITNPAFTLDEVVLGRNPKHFTPDKIKKLYEALSEKFGVFIIPIYEDGLNYLFRSYPNEGLARLYWVREIK